MHASRRRRGWSLGSCMVVLVTIHSQASCSKTCTTANCTAGASMQIDMQSTASSLVGQTVTVCRNAECYSAVLPAPPPANSTSPFSFAGTTSVAGEVWSLSDQTTRLDLEWLLPKDGQPPSLDRYTVSLTDGSGVSSTLLDKTAAYQKESPNGDECGPVCWHASLAP
jgi:hypothetical protein